MVNEDVIERIKSLTMQQKEIFRSICSHDSFDEIRDNLSLSSATLATQIGNIYIKLGLTDLPKILRKKIILDEYLPALIQLDSSLSEKLNLQPFGEYGIGSLTDHVARIVEEDFKIQQRLNTTRNQRGSSKNKHEGNKNWQQILRWFIIYSLIALLIFNLIYIYIWANRSLSGQ